MKKILSIIIVFFPIIIQSQNIYINGTKIKKNEYIRSNITTYNIISHIDGLPTNYNFSISIDGLIKDTTVKVLLRNINTTSIKILLDSVVVPSIGGVQTGLITADTLGISGSFFVEVNNQKSGSLIKRFEYNPLVIEKATTINIPGITGYNFLIHHSDNFFVNHPLGTTPTTFVNNYLTNAFLASWQKEVNDWNLCDGLNGNVPQDNDNTYHIYIHNISEIVGGFNNDQIRAHPVDGDRRIYIDSRPTAILNATSNITEKELIYELISHEFYHGIQFSHMSYDSIVNNFPDPAAELHNRNWLIEGQAKFLETVFMEDYSDSANNVTYSLNTHDHSYGDYTEKFLKEALDKDYQYKTI